jgi:hypothetical protein
MSEQFEKRTEERFPVGVNTACVFASPVLEDFGTVRVLNVSAHGIGLLSTEVVAPGLLLVCKLVNQSKNFSKTLLVHVVHVTPQPGRTYLIGGTLDTPLTYEELRMLVM